MAILSVFGVCSGKQDCFTGLAPMAIATGLTVTDVALRMRVFFADAFVLADVADQAERPAFAGRTVIGDFVRRGQNEFIARRRVVATPKAMQHHVRHMHSFFEN